MSKLTKKWRRVTGHRSRGLSVVRAQRAAQAATRSKRQRQARVWRSAIRTQQQSRRRRKRNPGTFIVGRKRRRH